MNRGIELTEQNIHDICLEELKDAYRMYSKVSYDEDGNIDHEDDELVKALDIVIEEFIYPLNRKEWYLEKEKIYKERNKILQEKYECSPKKD